MFFCVQRNSDWVFLRSSRNRGKNLQRCFSFLSLCLCWIRVCCLLLVFSLLRIFQTSSSCFISTNSIQAFLLMCLSPSRAPDFTVNAEASGQRNITKKKSKKKEKKRVLQTLRGHGLSTQDQGECQRPDVRGFLSQLC